MLYGVLGIDVYTIKKADFDDYQPSHANNHIEVMDNVAAMGSSAPPLVTPRPSSAGWQLLCTEGWCWCWPQQSLLERSPWLRLRRDRR